MAKKVTLRDTKNAIYKAYQEAVAEASKAEAQLKAKDNEISKLQSSISAAPIVKTVVKSSGTAEGADTVSGIIGVLQSVQEGVSKAVNNTSNSQAAEAEKLQNLQSQIREEQDQIKSLYDIEFNEDSLEEVIDAYTNEKENFEKSYAEKQEAQSKELTEARNEWSKECEENAVRIRERDNEAAKTRKRERDEYNYSLKLARDAEDDAYAQKRKKLQDKLDEISESRNEEFAAREKEVADREAQYNEYEEKFLGLDEQLKKDIKKAEAEGRAIIERSHKVKMKLLKADVDSAKKVRDLEISSAKDQIEKNDAAIKNMIAQIEKANQQIRDITIKKYELQVAASKENSSVLREIAMEQAKNSGKK